MIASSFTSAGVMPVKLLQSAKAVQCGRITPVHVQLCPTNKCNLSCSFCSCSKREKEDRLSIREMSLLVKDLADLGTEAITLTGGGDPTLYPSVNNLIYRVHECGIETGMVTNGIELGMVEVLDKLTWLRISVSDDRDIDQLSAVIHKEYDDRVDWAFSYVLTANPDWEKLNQVIRLANCHHFSHVRIVSDLMDLEHSLSGHDVRKRVKTDDSLCIYQDRQAFTIGAKECRISLLKPVIAPDGHIYPCCGVQYAIKGCRGMFPEVMRMGHISNIMEIYARQNVFAGSVCDKCYYGDYNTLLAAMTQKVCHKEFV